MAKIECEIIEPARTAETASEVKRGDENRGAGQSEARHQNSRKRLFIFTVICASNGS
jgi:hypothetical protein